MTRDESNAQRPVPQAETHDYRRAATLQMGSGPLLESPSPQRDLGAMSHVIETMERQLHALDQRCQAARFQANSQYDAVAELDSLSRRKRRAETLVSEAQTALRAWCSGQADAGLASAAIKDCSIRLQRLLDPE